MVEMHLVAVRVELPSHTPILLLQETGEGNRTLPIYIGSSEAQAIAYALQGVVTPRPMTHDLMKDMLDEMGATVDCVVITELRERTFYAEVRLRLNGRQVSVSARPSDAVALAVRASATIFAEDALVDAEGYVLHDDDATDEGGDPDDLMSQFKDFIEGIRPEDFER
ncbi:bifunctional nuclease family protein [Acidiferrimicrobium sp. IK]|uniref:bifunctional nuclease family protein n=1 Tax=Acidiferrimicrobium sp. IK TaxID=2871700 RepID=UPI0021CB5FEB|nr:bifunctional nuclease family protein [Acidiferrimicrobium sp. IK]MCU4184703.1 bifunctional nuclease family protein [Acidiferrimicrobium sp. IK]